MRSTITVALSGLALLALTMTSPNAAPRFSDWSEPVNLGPTVNSSFADFGPAISKDGRSLYFASDRPGGLGGQDLWVTQRASVKSPWRPPVNLGAAINTSALENVPALSRDEHWLFFNSNRPGGFGDVDIWVSWRPDTDDDFGWHPPVNLGAGVNSAFFDAGAGYFEKDDDDDDDGEEEEEEEEEEDDDGDDDDDADDDDDDDDSPPLLYFGSSRPGGLGLVDIYVSALGANGFGPARHVPELSSPANDQRPSVRSDGLELFFFSDRPGSLAVDLWVSTRKKLSRPWSTPENLGPVVNSASSDQQAYIARDGRTLFFASNRPGGSGLGDLYVTTRSRARDR